MRHPLLLALPLVTLLGGVAHAEAKVCVLDSNKAINETDEGRSAQTRLESMYAAKQKEIDAQQTALEREFADYEARRAILSEQARRDQERALTEKRAAFQEMVMKSEEEMQTTYSSLLEGMSEKLLRLAPVVGVRKGCAIVLDKSAAVYVGPEIYDLTRDVIAELDRN